MKGAHWFVRGDQCGYPETEFPPRSLILLSVYRGVENVEGSGECVCACAGCAVKMHIPRPCL